MSHEQPGHSQYYDRRWMDSPERFASLSASEIVAVASLTSPEYDGDANLGQQGFSVSTENIYGLLDRLPKQDPARAIEVFNAFVDSPDPAVRYHLAIGPISHLTDAKHAGGPALWNRLAGDPDKKVRDEAIDLFEEVVDSASSSTRHEGNEGFHAVDAVDETVLLAERGITRQDAYNIYESYAYAENGQYFDVAVGRAALAKINAIQPPQTS